METRGQYGSRLEHLRHLAEEAEAFQIALEVRNLEDRVRQGLFYVACLGQFKRGKSTLLNALVGERVLPVGVVPITAAITVVRHGETRRALVRFSDGRNLEIGFDLLADFVSEDRNPNNEKGIAAVEVFLPSDLLAQGMCLVDTPGISSVFANNTEVTRAFVPHVDAAIVVLGADPPISADEMALVKQVKDQCSELFFVLGKADRFQDGELREAASFTKRVLFEQAGLESPRFFVLSPARQLSVGESCGDWERFVGELGRLAKRSGSDLVRQAESRGFALLATRLSAHLEERLGALMRPLEESERRVEALRALTRDAETALNDLDYLFAAEHSRLSRAFAALKEEFLGERLEAAIQELDNACQVLRGFGPSLRQACIQTAREIATRFLDEWLAETEPKAERLYSQAMDRFIEASNDFLARLRASGDPALARLPAALPPELGFRWDSRLFYKDLFHATGQGPWTWIADWFRPKGMALRSMRKRAGQYLTQLLQVNATRIENDLNERVLESRRRLAFEIRNLIFELVDSAAGSLERARQVHLKGREAVEHEIKRLENLLDQLRNLEKGSPKNSDELQARTL